MWQNHGETCCRPRSQSSDLQRHLRVWVVTPGRERVFSPSSPAGQWAAFYEPLMASPGFQRVWKCLRRSLCCDCCHCICFASSRRNPNLVANAALQCAWLEVPANLLWTFFLLFYKWVYWQVKEASTFSQWYKLEFDSAPNNRFKDLTQP